MCLEVLSLEGFFQKSMKNGGRLLKRCWQKNSCSIEKSWKYYICAWMQTFKGRRTQSSRFFFFFNSDYRFSSLSSNSSCLMGFEKNKEVIVMKWTCNVKLRILVYLVIKFCSFMIQTHIRCKLLIQAMHLFQV